MPTPITIHVRNNSKFAQNFFVFQKPASYIGGQQVYCNSLYMRALPPHVGSGIILTFSVAPQVYAGVQRQTSPPIVGAPSGQSAVFQAIDLTPASGPPTNNATTMTSSPSLSLSQPVFQPGVQTGAFRITTSMFNPANENYNVGSAVQTLAGDITLSSFVTAQPSSNQDCQPVSIFYVQTGSYSSGMVMNFSSAAPTAATCDATSGYSTFDVHYNANGTWTVINNV